MVAGVLKFFILFYDQISIVLIGKLTQMKNKARQMFGFTLMFGNVVVISTAYFYFGFLFLLSPKYNLLLNS